MIGYLFSAPQRAQALALQADAALPVAPQPVRLDYEGRIAQIEELLTIPGELEELLIGQDKFLSGYHGRESGSKLDIKLGRMLSTIPLKTYTTKLLVGINSTHPAILEYEHPTLDVADAVLSFSIGDRPQEAIRAEVALSATLPIYRFTYQAKSNETVVSLLYHGTETVRGKLSNDKAHISLAGKITRASRKAAEAQSQL